MASYRITIYDVAGRQIQILGGNGTGTEQVVHWNLKDRAGKRVASGTYLYRFESDAHSADGKIVIW